MRIKQFSDDYCSDLSKLGQKSPIFDFQNQFLCQKNSIILICFCSKYNSSLFATFGMTWYWWNDYSFWGRSVWYIWTNQNRLEGMAIFGLGIRGGHRSIIMCIMLTHLYYFHTRPRFQRKSGTKKQIYIKIKILLTWLYKYLGFITLQPFISDGTKLASSSKLKSKSSPRVGF